MKLNTCAIAVSLIISAAVVVDAQEVHLSEELSFLEPYIGSWTGEFTNAPEGQSISDDVTFEVILNGKAVRQIHRVSFGYGGETIYMWNTVTQRVHFWYFTNSGDYAEGYVEKGDKGELHFRAHHYNASVSGWTAWTRMLENGTYESASRYFQNGEWTDGHAVKYSRSE